MLKQSTNASTEISYKRSHRKVMGVLLVSIVFCTMLHYIIPSLFMTEIMDTFGCDLAAAGLSMTVELVVAGVFFFAGTFFVDKIGTVMTCKLSIWLIAIGTVITAAANSMGIFFAGRIIAGLGYGLSVGVMPLISCWFEGKEQSLMITFNTMGSAIAMALSAVISSMFVKQTGSWQSYLWFAAIVSLFFAVWWTISGKQSPEGIERETKQREKEKETGKTQSSLGIALKDGQCWKVTICMAVFIVVDTVRATFMPTFQGELGVSQSLIILATSMYSMVGIVGSLSGGIIAAKIVKRKPVLIAGYASYMVLGLLATILTLSVPNVICVLLLGLAYNIPITCQSLLLMEYAMDKNPMLISGGTAMMSGIGMLLTIVVSPVYAGLVSGVGSVMAFRIVFLLLIFALVAVLTLKETGKTDRKGE